MFDTATSFNGFVADEDNSLVWHFAVAGADHLDGGLFPSEAGVMVEGSITYEWVLAESDILAHPDKWAEFHGDRPSLVFTTRDLPVAAGAGICFVSGPVAEALCAIREAAGDGDIRVVGGGDLAGKFLNAGALDDIALSVAPVALTGGASLFPGRVESSRLPQVSATAFGQFGRLRYRATSAGM